MIINMFAGPGAGKSTTATALFALLKLHQDIQCELVTEFAKDVVWEERYHTLENQNYIFSKQQHRIWRLDKKVDLILTDSPTLLSCIYGVDLTSEKFKEYVMEDFMSYNNLNFFIERTKLYIENGRNQTEVEAIKIDDTIKNYLRKHYIYFYPITGDVEGINMGLDIILGYLGKEKKIEINYLK